MICLGKGEDDIEQANRQMVINMLSENEPMEKICRYAQCDEAYVIQVKEILNRRK